MFLGQHPVIGGLERPGKALLLNAVCGALYPILVYVAYGSDLDIVHFGQKTEGQPVATLPQPDHADSNLIHVHCSFTIYLWYAILIVQDCFYILYRKKG